MATSRNTQNKIIKLYVKERLSAMQIAEKLDVSNSAVCYWLTKQKVKKRSISEAITDLYLTKFSKKPFRLKEAVSKFDNELKISGVMLYWGEGSKTGNSIKLANSDPEMIKLFLNFLRNICGIYEERLKALIHMYPDQNENELKKFWSESTGIPIERFYKSHVHKGGPGTYKNKSRYGTIAINYSDKKLLHILLSWIDQYKMKLALDHRPK